MDVRPQEIADQLARLERSAGFARAERLVRFLRYITAESLAGHADQLKEYTIATEVFGRPSTYDPQVDSLVRVQASLLRSRLRQFYEAEGGGEPIRIEIPKGSYAPVFHRVPTAEPEPLPKQPKPRRLVAAMAAALTLTGLAVWLVVGMLGARPKTEIAASVSRTLRDQYIETGRAQKPSANAEAYRHFMAGMFWRMTPTLERLRKAAGEFSAAVASDPDYAPAEAALAEAYGRLYFTETVSAEESLIPAKAAASKAIELDDKLALAHEANALVHLIDWDLTGAETEYQRALKLDPTSIRIQYAYAQLCLVPAGRYADAIRQLSKALELDPVSANLITELGADYRITGQLDRARSLLLRGLELQPDAFGTRTNLAAADSMEGRFADAIRMLEAVNTGDPDDPWIQGHLGYAYAKAGRIADARKVLAQIESRSTAAMHIAAIHAGLNETDRALDMLEQGVAARSPSMLWLKSDFRFAALRSTPRFAALLAQYR